MYSAQLTRLTLLTLALFLIPTVRSATFLPPTQQPTPSPSPSPPPSKPPAKYDQTPNAPTPDPHPNPVRQAFDFCSATESCATGLFCRNERGRHCLTGDAPCVCVRPHAQPCRTSNDCGSRELCANHPKTREPFCTSCSILAQEALYTAADTLSKCAEVTLADLPAYPPSNNGVSGDECASDLTCQQPRTCVHKRSHAVCTPLDPPGTCTCAPAHWRTCKSSAECEQGEACLKYLTTKPTCLSLRLAAIVRPSDGHVVDKPVQAPQPVHGLSGDACRFDWQCKDGRRCTHLSNIFGGCAGRRACRCERLARPACSSHDACDTGERCVKYPDAVSQPYCESAVAVRADDLLMDFDYVPEAPGAFAGNALSTEACAHDGDCMGERVCLHVGEWHGRCNGRSTCFCDKERIEDAVCKQSADCPTGELCFRMKDAIDAHNFCGAVSFSRTERARYYEVVDWRSLSSDAAEADPQRSAEPSPVMAVEALEGWEGLEGGPTPVFTPLLAVPAEAGTACIAIQSLPGVSREDLVYKQDRLARVLCNSHGDCATPGHVVVWGDRPMMMKNYCKITGGCVNDTMRVNSPRMSRKWRLQARRPRLAFTAFAASFETGVEESFIGALIHAGL